jgi:xylose isomerase
MNSSFRPVNKIKLGDGKFDYVVEPIFKNMLVNAFDAINQTNMWRFVFFFDEKENFNTYIYTEIDTIMKKMVSSPFYVEYSTNVPYSGSVTTRSAPSHPLNHDYDSFSVIMQNMQFIVMYGIDKWRYQYENNTIPNKYFRSK